MKIDLGRESVPDATTLLKFRHPLKQHALTQEIVKEINAHLSERNLLEIPDNLLVKKSTLSKSRQRSQNPFRCYLFPAPPRKRNLRDPALIQFHHAATPWPRASTPPPTFWVGGTSTSATPLEALINAIASKGQRPVPSQPRATPWVNGPNGPSPEGAKQLLRRPRKIVQTHA